MSSKHNSSHFTSSNDTCHNEPCSTVDGPLATANRNKGKGVARPEATPDQQTVNYWRRRAEAAEQTLHSLSLGPPDGGPPDLPPSYNSVIFGSEARDQDSTSTSGRQKNPSRRVLLKLAHGEASGLPPSRNQHRRSTTRGNPGRGLAGGPHRHRNHNNKAEARGHVQSTSAGEITRRSNSYSSPYEQGECCHPASGYGYHVVLRLLSVSSGQQLTEELQLAREAGEGPTKREPPTNAELRAERRNK